MLFSTPVFLFGFLPLTLAAYYLAPRFLRNGLLLCASLLFYAWGEAFYVLIMLASIAANYSIGRLLGASATPGLRRGWLVLGVVLNLALLVSFKYANFIVDNINAVLSIGGGQPILLAPVHLPLGISFFTFQALSYIVDVYRRENPPQRKLLDLALYIALFPQLIAGPIVRYHDVAAQIVSRQTDMVLFASGVRRFVYGLAKKMLLANPLGEIADLVFALPGNELSLPLAWIGIVAYSLQIYFDFSGYSDMAIGLGRMFGFRFLENFNYPYIAASVQEFWRRWHISLSSWFRDYLYIPLGGNRVGAARVYVNLLIVFVATGFWHGAAWNFLVWGLFHGAFLVVERLGLDKVLRRVPALLRHTYVLLVVMCGWVFFRAEDLPAAINYLGAMVDAGRLALDPVLWAQVSSREMLLAMGVGVLLSMPFYPSLSRYGAQVLHNQPVILRGVQLALLVALYVLVAIKMASATYNPFIYFRF